MKHYICLIILLLLCMQQTRAQGIPQYKLNYPSTPQVGDTAIGNILSLCDNYSVQTALDFNWFQQTLPRKGTITALFLHVPIRRDTIKSPHLKNSDTILAGSPIIGTRIRMALSNHRGIGLNGCPRVMNFTTVFNTPVYYVPSALQGDDTTKCWLKFPLNPPFSYDADAPFDENDTTTYRNLVIEFISDSNTVNRQIYDPSKNTSWIKGRAYYHINVHSNNKSATYQGPNSCNAPVGCTGIVEGNVIPVIGLDLAPTSIEDVSGKIQQLSFYPNPATNRTTLSLEAKEKIRQLSLTLTGITGNVIKTENYRHVGGSFSREIDLGALPRGVYIAEIKADGERAVKKLVVQ